MQDKIIFFQNKKADSNLIAIVTMLLLVVISQRILDACFR